MTDKRHLKLLLQRDASDNDKPEKDVCKEKIQTWMKELKDAWGNFPEDWTDADFHSLCRGARRIWTVIDRLRDIEKEEARELAKLKAQSVYADGLEFESITILGKTFVADDGILEERQECPF